MDLAALFFGAFLGVFAFTLAKVIGQTRAIWRRTRSVANAYMVMIWVETWVNFIFALVTFLYLNQIIPGSLGFYLGAVMLWAIQTQLLSQIIANRVSLIMASRRKATILRWSLFVAIGSVNIAVSGIWTTAMMPNATPAQVRLNFAFENAEKAFFLVIDLGLNLLFLYLVRFRLINEGLTKYWKLYNFNACIVVISTSMDAVLLGMVNLRDSYLYVQFAPLAYIIKLYIELTMAVLISKVVKTSNNTTPSRRDGLQQSSTHSHSRVLERNHGASSRVAITGGHGHHATRQSGGMFVNITSKDIEARGGSAGSEIPLAATRDRDGMGIVKTVETTVVVDDREGRTPAKEEGMVIAVDEREGSG